MDKGFMEALEKTPVSHIESWAIVTAANTVHLTDFEKQIRLLHNKYFTLLQKNELSKDFYCPDIRGTSTITILYHINEVLKNMRAEAIKPGTDKYKEAETTAEAIIRLSKQIKIEGLSISIFFG